MPGPVDDGQFSSSVDKEPMNRMRLEHVAVYLLEEGGRLRTSSAWTWFVDDGGNNATKTGDRVSRTDNDDGPSRLRLAVAEVLRRELGVETDVQVHRIAGLLQVAREMPRPALENRWNTPSLQNGIAKKKEKKGNSGFARGSFRKWGVHTVSVRL